MSLVSEMNQWESDTGWSWCNIAQAVPRGQEDCCGEEPSKGCGWQTGLSSTAAAGGDSGDGSVYACEAASSLVGAVACVGQAGGRSKQGHVGK